MGKAKRSAGILLYRLGNDALEVLLAHPGGPFWARKDAGAWTIPKGELDDEEDALAAARRELREETGIEARGDLIALTPVKQRGGKTVHAWAMEGDCDARAITSNTFEMEWPPRSGRTNTFPEIDRAEWFTLEHARAKILSGQAPLLDELWAILVAGRRL